MTTDAAIFRPSTPRLLCSLFAALLLLGGCAKQGPAPDASTRAPASDGSGAEEPAPPDITTGRIVKYQWSLSEDARASFHFLQYQDALRDRNIEVAEAAIKKLLELDPSPAIYAEAANFFWRTERMDQAKVLLKEGLKTHEHDRELTLLLAQAYLSDDRVDDATLTMEAYLRAKPDDLDMRHELADLLISADRHAKAHDVLIEAVTRGSFTPMTRYFLAKAQAGLGLRKNAIEQLNMAVDEDPFLVEAWAELAFLYEVEKDFVAAEETYTRILELGETSDELWLRLVELNLKLNDPDKALDLVFRGPERLSFVLTAGTLFLNNKFYDHAERILAPLAQRDPRPEDLNFYLALLAYEGRNKPEAALKLLANVPETSKHYQRSLHFRTHILYDIGRVEDSLALARESRTRYPDSPELYLLEAGIFEAEKDYAQAEALLNEALDKWPNEPELLYRLGVVMDKSGDKVSAIEMMERIIQLDPQFANALNYLGYTLADKEQDLERAYVLIKKALEQKPDSGYILDSMAWVHYKRGELDQAWDFILRALDREPEDPVVWEHYGDIAAARGDLDTARDAYAKALELEPEEPEAVQRKLDAL